MNRAFVSAIFHDFDGIIQPGDQRTAGGDDSGLVHGLVHTVTRRISILRSSSQGALYTSAGNDDPQQQLQRMQYNERDEERYVDAVDSAALDCIGSSSDSSLQHPIPEELDTRHLRLVSKLWASESGAELPSRACLALIDTSPDNNDNSNIISVIEEELQQRNLQGVVCRFKDSLVLLKFASKDALNDFYDFIIRCRELPFHVNHIEGAFKAEDVNPCFLNVVCSNSTFREEMAEALALPSFGGNRFVHVAHSTVARSPARSPAPAARLPRFIVRFGFVNKQEGRNYYNKSIELMTEESTVWQSVQNHGLDHTEVFSHKDCPELAFGFYLGARTVSIEYVVSVTSERKLEQMKAFYSKVFKKPSTSTSQQRCIIGISNYAEVVLRYHDAPLLPASQSVSLSIQLNTIDHVTSDIIRPLESGWSELCDPDGNCLQVTVPLS